RAPPTSSARRPAVCTWTSGGSRWPRPPSGAARWSRARAGSACARSWAGSAGRRGRAAAPGWSPRCARGPGAPPARAARRAAGGGRLVDGAGLIGTVELDGIRLVAASDVENPLLGEHGAARTFGPQKRADELTVRRLERSLTRWADVLAEATGRDVRDEPGAGAAGGLGAARLALGAPLESGAGLVRRLTGLDAAMDGVDLVVTGEGSFDWQSLRGKLVTSVASAAAERGLPCLALAGQVSVGRRQAAAAGVERAYSVAEHAGS